MHFLPVLLAAGSRQGLLLQCDRTSLLRDMCLCACTDRGGLPSLPAPKACWIRPALWLCVTVIPSLGEWCADSRMGCCMSLGEHDSGRHL